MKSRLLTPNRTFKTAPTCGDIARGYLVIGLGLGYLGWNVVGVKYGGDPLFFWPGVGLLLGAFTCVSYWATEQLIVFLNYIGRNSAAYTAERDTYGEEVVTEVPAMWREILGPKSKPQLVPKPQEQEVPAQWKFHPSITEEQQQK